MKRKTIHQLMQASLISAVASTAAYAEPTIEFGGVVEASISKAENDDKSQMAVDTVELGITATMNESVSAEIVLLQEDINTDDQTDLEVDAALIHMQAGPATVSVGKFTVPFTTGETNMIEDSTTLVEPVGVGIAVSGAISDVEYTVYAADPAAGDTGDILYGDEEFYADEGELGFGDLAGINVNIPVTEDIAINASYAQIDDKTGTSAALMGSMGEFGLILEASSIEDEDENRTNIELSYDMGFGALAASVQKDGEGNEFRSLGFAKEIYESTALNIQYMIDDTADESSVAAMVAYEF